MRRHNVSSEIQQRVRRAITNMYSENAHADKMQPEDVLHDLQPYLKQEVLQDCFYKGLMNIDYFKHNFSKHFLQKLSMTTHEKLYSKDEIIIKEKQQRGFEPSIYYIAQGAVEKYIEVGKHERVLQVLSAGQCFGQYEFITNATCGVHSVRCTKNASIYVIRLDEFLSLLNSGKFNEEREKFYNTKDRVVFGRELKTLKLS